MPKQKGLSNAEVLDAEGLKSLLLQKAVNLMNSKQNPPEWPGAQFLRPKTPYEFERIERRFSKILEEFQLDPERGIMVDGIPLDSAVLNHVNDPIADNPEEAFRRGFWSGVHEALDWIGVIRTKRSSLPPGICALEALAAAEGIPTSRQCNHMQPELLVGARVKVRDGKKKFVHGSTNGIFRDGEGRPIYLRCARRKFHNELTKGYRKGVETAFLHYVAIGSGRVLISPIERLLQVFSAVDDALKRK